MQNDPSLLSVVDLLDAAPDPIFLVDDQGKIVLANTRTEEVFGYSKNEVVGQLVEILVPTAARHSHVDLRDRYAKVPRSRPMGGNLELFGERKNGSKVPLGISLSPYQHDGRDYVIAIARDMTEMRHKEQELRRQKKELERSNEDLEQFAYLASHDLQEPLRHINGYCQILSEDHRDALDAEGQRCIDVVTKASSRMQQMIQDLLSYSRVGRKNWRLTDVDMAEVVTTAKENIQTVIEESGAEISEEGLPQFQGDFPSLVRLTQNLISNAIKFRREGVKPKIKIVGSKVEDQWVLRVIDNGIGIAEEYHDRVFMLFQRLHGPGKFTGTGIGLAVCKKVVERLGGEIWIESNDEQGATFAFSIPARRGEARNDS